MSKSSQKKKTHHICIYSLELYHNSACYGRRNLSSTVLLILLVFYATFDIEEKSVIKTFFLHIITKVHIHITQYTIYKWVCNFKTKSYSVFLHQDLSYIKNKEKIKGSFIALVISKDCLYVPQLHILTECSDYPLANPWSPIYLNYLSVVIRHIQFQMR